MKASQLVTTFQPARPPERWSRLDELPGQLVRLVEGRVQRADQTDVLRDGGERGEHRERVGPARDVVLEHAAGALAQRESLGEEEVIEPAALGGLGDVAERVERDLAARVGVLPRRVLVDARRRTRRG